MQGLAKQKSVADEKRASVSARLSALRKAGSDSWAAASTGAAVSALGAADALMQKRDYAGAQSDLSALSRDLRAIEAQREPAFKAAVERGESALQQGTRRKRRRALRRPYRSGRAIARRSMARGAQRPSMPCSRCWQRQRGTSSKGGSPRPLPPIGRRRRSILSTPARNRARHERWGSCSRTNSAVPWRAYTRRSGSTSRQRHAPPWRRPEKSSPTIRRSHEPPPSCRPWTPPPNWRELLPRRAWLRAASTGRRPSPSINTPLRWTQPWSMRAARCRSLPIVHTGWRAATNHFASRTYLQRCRVCRRAHQFAAGTGHILPRAGAVAPNRPGFRAAQPGRDPCGCHFAFRQPYERRRVSNGPFGQLYAARAATQPGRYVIVGTRSGYRDVRRELTVAPGKAPAALLIQCVDPV